MRLLRIVVLLGLASCAPVVAPVPSGPVELTYYYLKFCSFCQGVRTNVEALPSKYPGQLTVRTVEHLEPEVKAAVAQLGFKSHGLVMRRGGEVVFRQPDHRVEVEQVRLALERMLGPPLEPLAVIH